MFHPKSTARSLSSANGRGNNRRKLRSAARASQAVRVGCCSLWVIRFRSRCMDGNNDLRRGSLAPESVLASFHSCIQRGGEVSGRVFRGNRPIGMCSFHMRSYTIPMEVEASTVVGGALVRTFRMDLNAVPTFATEDGRVSRW